MNQVFTIAQPAVMVTDRPAPTLASRLMRGLKDLLPLVGFIILVMIIWELVKFIGGNVTRIDLEILGQQLETVWRPPLRFRFANDLNMPHLWDVFEALARPAQRNGPPLIEVLLMASLFTFRVALVGFAIGATFGLVLAIILVHSDLLSRAFVPYVVASQTVPILVIAPMIVIGLKAGWVSVSLIAAYLTFFPVTIAALRGLNSVDSELVELMRSYAASPLQILLKLRLPASAPYLFVGFKIAATASVIGTIVGELPSGIGEGLGNAVLNFAQYYSTGPQKLWATMFIAGLLGIGVFLLVHVAEVIFLRNRVNTD